MTTADKNIIEAYSNLFEGLSPINKKKLIERLARSLKLANKSGKNNFYKSFGAFASEKSAEDIVADIKANRKFRKTAIVRT